MLADILSWATIMAIPGPDIVAIGSQVTRHGYRAGFATAFGATLGVATWSLVSLAGISALLLALPALSFALPVLGSGVLVLLGIITLRDAARRDGDPAPGASLETGPVSSRSALRLGLMTNLSNPKALVFFTSFFTPLMNHYSGLAHKGGMLVLLLGVSAVTFATMSVALRAAAVSPLARIAGIRFLPGLAFVAIGSFYLWESLGG